jgi:hypothetical protein
VREESAGDVHHRRALYRHLNHSCVDVRPVDCIHEYERILIIDPDRRLRARVPGRGDLPGGRPPGQWEPFAKINYAHPDADPINSLVDEYAREHNVHNPPLEAR